MKKFYVVRVILIMLALSVTACGSSSGGGGDAAGGGGGSTFTADYTQRAIPSHSEIKIVFTQSIAIVGDVINRNTLVLGGGDMDAEVTSMSWSNTMATDDTLTISAERDGWSAGMNRQITVNVSTVQGQVLDQLDLVFDVFEGAVYFVNANAMDDSGDGFTPDTAKQSIQAAIQQSVNDGEIPAAVVVAEGSYTADSSTDNHIQLVEGVSLYGGYNNDPGSEFTAYDPATYATTITDISTNITGDYLDPNRTIEVASGVVGNIIDGFTINAGGGDYSAGILANGSPTISNNIIDGGNGSLQAYGIFSTGGGAIINNTINGGSSVADNLAIYSSDTVIIVGNTINGGSGGARTFGIYNDGAQVNIYDNTITGGPGSVNSFGIRNVALSTGLIYRNSIVGGTGANGSNYGINSTEGSSMSFFNNMIDGGGGNNTYGTREGTNTWNTLQNNTISGGMGSGLAIGVYIVDTTSTTLENNIIFTESAAGNTRCISEATGNSDPARVDNNDLFDCNGLYLDNGIDYLDLDGIHALMDTSASGNVADPANFCTGFICGGKWRFSGTTPDSVKTGGKNGTILGWGFSDSIDGRLRPAAVSWSLGAHCGIVLCPSVSL